ncbi:hypothetical protein L6452_14468 [Arctium lappa]|uniref:Uncharacterized protein n=1 Tax=Arctium lappa TaxID=4217 RepID=A0ACB9CL46_ARCLA|nr:hypothetical protein L6452_14468 [Arctium lappa]
MNETNIDRGRTEERNDGYIIRFLMRSQCVWGRRTKERKRVNGKRDFETEGKVGVFIVTKQIFVGGLFIGGFVAGLHQRWFYRWQSLLEVGFAGGGLHRRCF